MPALTFAILVICNGVFAMSEIAVISVRKARLQLWANKGDAKARAALALANAPSHFLSTVQIGITLVGILAGAFGGATIAEELAARLRLIPLFAPYSEALGLGLVVLGITFRPRTASHRAYTGWEAGICDQFFGEFGDSP